MGQNVLAIDLVVEHVEAVSRLVLRLAIQLDLKFPDLTRCCQTHRQSPLLPSFTSTPEVRALSSTGITRLHRCRVGGGALARWPPSAAQTVHAVFPHTAFTKTPASEMPRKESIGSGSPARTRRTTWFP